MRRETIGIAKRILDTGLARRDTSRAFEMRERTGFVVEPQRQPAQIKIQFHIARPHGREPLENTPRLRVVARLVERERLRKIIRRRGRVRRCRGCSALAQERGEDKQSAEAREAFHVANATAAAARKTNRSRRRFPAIIRATLALRAGSDNPSRVTIRKKRGARGGKKERPPLPGRPTLCYQTPDNRGERRRARQFVQRPHARAHEFTAL
ncbi:MAG TPA: hypothetical protein VHD62_02290 [Opitutaceae bacterium]|nr:hypothetical protein [Opitutaceae bacterium]